MSIVQITCGSRSRKYSCHEQRTVGDMLSVKGEASRAQFNELCLHHTGSRYQISQGEDDRPFFAWHQRHLQELIDFLADAQQRPETETVHYKTKRLGFWATGEMIVWPGDGIMQITATTRTTKNVYVADAIFDHLLIDLRKLASGQPWNQLNQQVIRPKHELIDLGAALFRRRLPVH